MRAGAHTAGSQLSRVALQRLNIARICCFLRMSTMIAYPVERIEASPLNLSNGLTSFQRKRHVAILLLACLSRGT